MWRDIVLVVGRGGCGELANEAVDEVVVVVVVRVEVEVVAWPGFVAMVVVRKCINDCGVEDVVGNVMPPPITVVVVIQWELRYIHIANLEHC